MTSKTKQIQLQIQPWWETYISLVLQIFLELPTNVIPYLFFKNISMDSTIKRMQTRKIYLLYYTSTNPSTEQETRNCPSGENLAHSGWLFFPNCKIDFNEVNYGIYLTSIKSFWSLTLHQSHLNNFSEGNSSPHFSHMNGARVVT